MNFRTILKLAKSQNKKPTSQPSLLASWSSGEGNELLKNLKGQEESLEKLTGQEESVHLEMQEQWKE